MTKGGGVLYPGGMGNQQGINLEHAQEIASLKVRVDQHDEGIAQLQKLAAKMARALVQIKFILIVLIIAVIASGDGAIPVLLQGVLKKLV